MPGTLDPMATGLLVVRRRPGHAVAAVPRGPAETYEGTFRLGVETTTLDADGEVVPASAPVDVWPATCDDAGGARWLGATRHDPRHTTARQGRRSQAHEAARRGRAPSRRPAPIVRSTGFDATDRASSDVDFIAVVSGGTYVRVLVADVGAALGCGAHLTPLRRTAIGPFSVTRPGRPTTRAAAAARARGAHLPRFGSSPTRPAPRAHGSGPAAIEGPYGVTDPAAGCRRLPRRRRQGSPARDPRPRVAQSSTWKNTASDQTASTSVPPTTATVKADRRDFTAEIEIGRLGGRAHALWPPDRVDLLQVALEFGSIAMPCAARTPRRRPRA